MHQLFQSLISAATLLGATSVVAQTTTTAPQAPLAPAASATVDSAVGPATPPEEPSSIAPAVLPPTTPAPATGPAQSNAGGVSPTDTPAPELGPVADTPATLPTNVPSVEPSPEVTLPVSLKAQFGKGITIGTPDETFTLNIRARMQLQASYYDAHDEETSDVTQVQMRRVRVVFQGNVYGPDLTYYLQLAFSNRDTEPDVRLPLRDAYFTYAPHASANFRFGQMKVPYGRQRVVSSSAQGMVDRSMVVTELNLDRDVGVQMFSKDLFGVGERLGYALGVFGGDGRNRLATNAGYLFVGRLSVTPFGSFDELVEADIGREDKPRLSVAAGAVRNQATNRPQSTIGTPYADPTVFFDYTHFGVDFMFKYKGFFATGEWMYRKADDSIKSVEDEEGQVTDFYSRDAWGAYAQLGQMLTDKLELTARYGHLNPLTETDPKLSLTHELGGGLSYYFEQHNLKVQGDYFYYAKNNDLKDGDHQVRVQTQLFF